MRYRIDAAHLKRFFAVPCAAVENYIKITDPKYFKVLLYLLCSDECEADTEEIAKACDIAANEAEDGILWWKSRDIISAEACQGTPSVQKDEPPKAAAASAPVQAVPVCVTEAVDPMKNTAAARSVVRYSNKEIAEKVKADKELKTLFDETQRVFGRPINATETAGLINLYEYYGYDVPSIVMIAEFCCAAGKPKIAYIETVAKDWFAKGIYDFSQVENEIIRQTEQNGFNAKTARTLGIEGRLTKKQEELFTQWKEWGFDIEVIDLAGQRCRENKNKTDIRYINGILSRWKQDGLMTTEAVEENERQHRETIEKNKKAENGKGSPDDTGSWSSMAAAFDPNAFGFEEDDDI